MKFNIGSFLFNILNAVYNVFTFVNRFGVKSFPLWILKVLYARS